MLWYSILSVIVVDMHEIENNDKDTMVYKKSHVNVIELYLLLPTYF